MERIKFVLMVCVGFFVSLVMSGVALAAGPWIDVSSIAIDTAPIATLGLTILAGLASIWVLRKLVKTANRS